MNKLKRGRKTVCFLVLGDSQNIGGFASVEDAIIECERYGYSHARITDDERGENTICYQDVSETEIMACGCCYHYEGWRMWDGKLAWQRLVYDAVGTNCYRVYEDMLHRPAWASQTMWSMTPVDPGVQS